MASRRLGNEKILKELQTITINASLVIIWINLGVYSVFVVQKWILKAESAVIVKV